jgi:integrase
VRRGFFTTTEVERLLPHLEADLQDFVRWCSFVGMRKGEAAAMEWSMLDRSGPTWVLNLPGSIAKTGDSRVLPLAGTAKAIIERRLAARRLGCDWIFHRTSKGQPGQPIKAFDKAWANALKAAKLPKDRLFHDLRRSAVRNLVRAGVDPLQAMAVSGHKTRSIFDRYDITSAEEVAAAMLKVDEANKNSHI